MNKAKPERKRPATKEPKSNNGDNVYGLTVRHNPTYKSDGSRFTDHEKRTLYERLIGWMECKGLKLDNIYYESKGGLHFHARATYHKKLYFKAWKQTDFHILFKKVYDEAGWLSYCVKEKRRDIHNYYMNNYAFNSSDD